MRVEYERWCLHNMKYITSNNRRCELSDTGAALAAKAHDARSEESAHVAEPRAGSENEVRAQKKKDRAKCTRSTRCPVLARQRTALIRRDSIQGECAEDDRKITHTAR